MTKLSTRFNGNPLKAERLIVDKSRALFLGMTVACLVFLVQITVQPVPQEASHVGTPLLAAMCSCIPLALFFPIASAVIYSALAAVCMFYLEIDPGVQFFTATALLGVLAYSKKYVSCALFLIPLLALSWFQAEPPSLKPEFESTSISAIFAAAAFSTGFFLRRNSDQVHFLRANEQQRQQELVEVLHNSIASNLASIVVSLDVLAQGESPPNKEIARLADQGRQALETTRSLIKESAESRYTSSAHRILSFDASMSASLRTLRAAGFQISTQLRAISIPDTEHFCSVIESCINEATSNIAKYAEPHSLVVISSSINENQFVLEYRNKIGPSAPSDLSNNVGFRFLRKELATVSGTFEYSLNQSYWTSTFSIPLPI